MATIKKRVYVSLPKDIEKTLYALAERDAVPPATKAASLIQYAIEVSEDELLDQIVSERDTQDTQFISHEDVWKNV